MTICEWCEVSPCVCDADDPWLYKDHEDTLSPEKFLEWHRKMGYGEVTVDKPIDVPWEELVKLVQLVLILTGTRANPEDVAREMLPAIRGNEQSTTRAREEAPRGLGRLFQGGR